MINDKNPETLLRDGTKIILPPKGFSMYPFINPNKGDQVIIEPCDSNYLKTADVVLYRRSGPKGKLNFQQFEGGILILHRIWKKTDNEFYMLGDNQKIVEGPIYGYQILGKMTAIIKQNKVIKVTNPIYIIKSRIWLILRPFRPAISHTIARTKKYLIKISKNK